MPGILGTQYVGIHRLHAHVPKRMAVGWWVELFLLLVPQAQASLVTTTQAWHQSPVRRCTRLLTLTPWTCYPSHSRVDESHLTGEPDDVPKEPSARASLLGGSKVAPMPL
jgi:hypothetical protein